jgi:hypothetical protein
LQVDCAFSPDGTAYFSTLTHGFTVWRNDDRNLDWHRLGTVPGGAYDRQWLAFDHGNGPARGRLYTAGKIPIHILGSPAKTLNVLSTSVPAAA